MKRLVCGGLLIIFVSLIFLPDISNSSLRSVLTFFLGLFFGGLLVLVAAAINAAEELHYRMNKAREDRAQREQEPQPERKEE